MKTFLIQTYILAVFKGETFKVILFSKINRFIRSTTQGSIRTDLIKKNNYNTHPHSLCKMFFKNLAFNLCVWTHYI